MMGGRKFGTDGCAAVGCAVSSSTCVLAAGGEKAPAASGMWRGNGPTGIGSASSRDARSASVRHAWRPRSEEHAVHGLPVPTACLQQTPQGSASHHSCRRAYHVFVRHTVSAQPNACHPWLQHFVHVCTRPSGQAKLSDLKHLMAVFCPLIFSQAVIRVSRLT